MNDRKNRAPEEGGGFNYIYSSKERAELKKIREKYLTESQSTELDKMEQIRLLDQGVSKDATVLALFLGVIGALIMGFGMSLIMTDLKNHLSLTGMQAMTVGIIFGVSGMLLILLVYPLYQLLTEKKRKKIAPEILRLTEELLERKN